MNGASSTSRDAVLRAEALCVGGLTPLSTTDFPGRLAAVVFCQGCPWRCAYCHNPHLLPQRGAQAPTWTDIMAFLQRRRGLLDAVVFSGGEPTLQPALPAALRAVRDIGFATGLHTAGISPRHLRVVLPLLDWVGMDIKAPFGDYARVTGVAGSGRRAHACMELILGSGIDHEFRTTVQSSLLPDAELLGLAAELAAHGVRHYALQECRGPGTAAAVSRLADPLIAAVAPLFPGFTVRRA